MDPDDHEGSSTSFVLTDQAHSVQLRTLAGGKAHNLHTLTAAGFPVPRWAVLSTDAFHAAVAAAGLQLSDAPLTLPERLCEAAYAESAMRDLVVPATVLDAIGAALDYVGSTGVAVRSSGRQEDGDAHSFAGLFDTFLNVTGPVAVADAVRRCWASAFSERAVRYRHLRGMDCNDLDDFAIAVIVQRLVQPRSSGVMFTADPVTGSMERIVINGVLGLGEGMVSGAVDADSVVVDKRTGAIVDENICAKQEMIVTGVAGGVRMVAVPVEQQRHCSVGPDLRDSLVDLASRLEHHFGTPQDIEWAAEESHTWILQSRPITTLINKDVAPPGADQLGEDVPPGELRVWDNSNIIESFAGVTSPLTFTTARKLYADVYRAYARSLKVPPAQLDQMESWLPVMLGQFNGHVYYNLLHWYRMVGIAPGYPLNRRVLEVALGVGEPLDRRTAKALRPYGFSNALAHGISRARTTITYARRFCSLDAMVARFDEEFEEFVDRHGLLDVSQLEGLDGPGACRLFRRIHDEVADIWGPMMVLDAILLTSVGALAGLTKTFLPDAPEWFGFAVVNPGADVVSIEPARALADIAAFARDHVDLWVFIDTASPGVAYPLLVDRAGDAEAPHWRVLLGKIDEYIDRFGYRCLDELKLEAPDLRQDPSGIFHMLRMASADEKSRAGDAGVAVQTYLDAHLHGLRRKVFDALRWKIQRAATHREHLRFCRTRGFGIMKSLVAVMGSDLEQRGIIDESGDVFLLRLDELFAVYEGSMSHAREVITRRRVLHEGYRKLKAPARFTTTGMDYAPEALTRAGWRPADEVTQSPAGTVLNGTPSSPGVVTGRAVVVEKPEDFSSGILVAYRTDPGWVAALPFASALLIERASPLTHVAIIARELGVPTVVQIDGLTSAIRTGMTISVDGASGRITLLEDQPEQASANA